MKLKVFSDRSHLPTETWHVDMLYPFWGKNIEDPSHLRSGCLDHYAKIGCSFFEMTSLAEADLVILPTHILPNYYNDKTIQELVVQFTNQAKQGGKKIAIFCKGDGYIDLEIENSFVIHHELYRSIQKSNEFAIPVWSKDFTKTYLDGQLQIRQKRAKPAVGFCGYAPPLGVQFNLRKIKSILRWGASYIEFINNRKPSVVGFAPRARALHTLSKSPLVETNFLIRDQFAFSWILLPGTPEEIAQQARQEFVQNMLESDYILCARGTANCSIRFYEAMSCGRIPVFIDTDCVLPYDFAVDWKKYCVWISERDLPRVAEKVAEFHNKLSPQEFVDLQYECRKLWEQWLSPEGYFANFYRHLQRV